MGDSPESANSGTRQYTDPNYNANWQQWIDIAQHQKPKDDVLFPQVMRWFRQGSVLELGAGTGQLSQRAAEAGFNTTASDYEQAMVDYMRSQHIQAERVDARNISANLGGRSWSTIFSQGASPLVTKDMNVVESVYRSVHDALEPQGRFVLIIARAANRAGFSRVADHKAIAKNCGFTTIKTFRNQVLPSPAYRIPGAALIEWLFGRFIGHRDIVVYEKA